MIFNEEWDNGESYAFTRNYEGFIKEVEETDNINVNPVSIEEKKEENREQQEYHVFLDKKVNLVNYIKSKINVF